MGPHSGQAFVGDSGHGVQERGCLQAAFPVEYMGSDAGTLGRKGGLDLAVTVGAFQERPVESC